MEKNKIKRVDLKILERVLLALYYLGNTKRTIISRNANMSYDKCIKYLDYLESSGAYHGLTGFDSAEDEATGEFTGGCWSSAKDSHSMGNEYTRKYIRNSVLESTAYNDGYATVINCS